MPHHTTRTGFFAEREAGFQVGFVAPTGSSRPVGADAPTVRSIFKSAVDATVLSNQLGQIAATRALTDAADGAEASGALALGSTTDHRLLLNTTGTRLVADESSSDGEDAGPAKEHVVRSAQALWSTNDGMPLSLKEFSEVQVHKDQLVALHANEVHSDSDEELAAQTKLRANGRPTSVGRLSRTNLPKDLPVEVFLDEYPTEIIDYLRCRWGTKHLREKQKRKLAVIKNGLRSSLGPSREFRTVMRACCCTSLILLAIAIYVGVLLYQRSAELFALQNPPEVADPNNIMLPLFVDRHDIALEHTTHPTQAGSSRVCRCFAASQLTEHQRIVSFAPDIVPTSTREVIASIAVYVTSADTEECLSEQNFDCADHYGGADSTLLMRWSSTQHGGSAPTVSMPQGVGLRVLPRIPGITAGETSAVGKHRLLLSVEYELSRMPYLMQQAVWSASTPWSAVGVRVQMRDSRALDHSAGVLSLAALGFALPQLTESQQVAFRVTLGQYSSWLSRAGLDRGLTVFGGQYTTRELGRSVETQLLRGNVTIPGAESLRTVPSDGGRALRMMGDGFPHLQVGDSIEVACRFNSLAKLTSTGSSWESVAGSTLGTELSEICLSQLYFYPVEAIDFPHRTAQPGECSESAVDEVFVG